MKLIKIAFNIGLNNNAYKVDGIKTIVKEAFKTDVIHKSFVETGLYNGVKESTLVLSIWIKKHSKKEIDKIVSKMCIEFTQECIPYDTKEFSKLVYNPHYKGEKFEFNDAYFIES